MPFFTSIRRIRFFLFFSLIALPSMLLANGVKGKVLDEQGKPLPFATIFVKESGSGAVTNGEGDYEIRLDPGTYELVFQFLGYRTETRNTTVGSDWQTLDVTLQVQPIELKMAGINLGGEDPAYTVMRKAIAKAGYHRQQLDSYSAQVYVKGSGRLINAPFYLRKTLKKEGIDSTKAFTTESVSLIEYKRPSTFKEKVISIRTQGDDYNTDPMPYINGSFYEPKVAEAISPLSPKAFGYYRFKLESFFVDRGFAVNKIKVTPRSQGENLFDGYLYIVEDYWSIYSLSLATYKFGIRFDIDQVYSPIQGEAWLPVSHKFKVFGKLVGFSFEFNYLATASKYQITLNPDLPKGFDVIDERVEKELAEEARQQQKAMPPAASPMERLSSGQELTRKELRKILNEYEKEETKEVETPEIAMTTTMTVDSQARKRDSLYWELIRPVPLSVQEVKGYRFSDSISLKEAEKRDSAKTQTTLTISANGEEMNVSASTTSKHFKPQSLIMGASYQFKKKHQFSYDNLLLHSTFNPVEGFAISNNIAYRYRAPKSFGATLTPRYSFARDRVSAKSAVFFQPANTQAKKVRWELEGGRYTFQYNSDNPLNEWLSAYLNLVEERNYIRLYEKEFVRLDYQREKASDWEFNAGFEWANRTHLRSRTTQTWFPKENRDYGDNTPLAEEALLPLPAREKAAVLSLQFEIRPWQKYQKRNNWTSAIEHSSPTLGIRYRKGIEGLGESVTNFDFLETEFRHALRVGASGLLDLKLNTGMFLNKRYVGFGDFKHFPGNQIGVVTNDPVSTYRLLDYYRFSTSDKYLSAFAHNQFRKLLLTQIRPVWVAGLKENLFVNYLATPRAVNYVEIGYGVDNIFRFFRLEAAASFEGGKYQDFGIFLGIASNLDNLGRLFGN